MFVVFGRVALIAICAAQWVSGPAMADKVWRQIAPGYTWDYADAYCRNASMGVGSSYYAYGSTSYVAGAALGNAIGNLIQQEQFYKNCMTMAGWKRFNDPTKKTRYKTNFNSGHVGESK